MLNLAWDRPEECDHVLLLADDDPAHLQALCDRLGRSPGRLRVSALGRYPRFKIVAVRDGEEALLKASPEISVAAVDLVMPRRNGIEVIQELRSKRPDLAILAFTAGAPPSEAVAAIMAGADHFHEYSDIESFEHAVELAIDRRRLTRLIERNEAEVDEARQRLQRMTGGLGPSLPGLRPPQTAEAVIPLEEATRRYLLAAARIFEGDPQGMAKKLEISYFALRRLLKRHDVPFPGRTNRPSSRKG
ncbi:MAG TPA: response regulator [Anaeromyxobacteraceae bacterium]|nr:response regulator [Anaeromyxobacteraceae bacterium]